MTDGVGVLVIAVGVDVDVSATDGCAVASGWLVDWTGICATGVRRLEPVLLDEAEEQAVSKVETMRIRKNFFIL
jgi:hypothetical protein